MSLARIRLDETCLAAVLPVTARRFRVSAPGLAASLAAAGLDIMDAEAGSPDVEVAEEGWTGDAAVVVANLGVGPEDRDPAGPALLARPWTSVLLRSRAGLTRRRLRRSGYPQVAVHYWDLGLPMDICDLPPPVRTDRTDWLRRRAVITATKRPVGPTLFSEALTTARSEVDDAGFTAPLAKAGLLVSLGGTAVLRVAVGGASQRLLDAAVVDRTLRELASPPVVADRVPAMLAHGHVGPARWTVQSRLGGQTARPPLGQQLLHDSVEFLVALHGLDRRGHLPRTGSRIEVAAGVVAQASPDAQDTVRRLGERAAETLVGIPSVFGHGDYWHGNLLVEGARLHGVIDWDDAGPGHLPLLDLLHLWVNANRRRGDTRWGPAVVEALLPWVSDGRDQALTLYSAALGLQLDRGARQALTIAYWLDRCSRQILTYADRAHRPTWLQANVVEPARGLATAIGV